jgi:alanyl-tRNA synthetase
MELCAGTRTRGSGEIGLFRILAESAIAAVAGLGAALTKSDAQRLHDIAGLLNAPAAEIEKIKKKIEALLANQKELEKALKAARLKEAATQAKDIATKAETINEISFLAASVSPTFTSKIQAGKIIQTIAPLVGRNGGGKDTAKIPEALAAAKSMIAAS